MRKQVNGQVVILSDEEEAAVLDEWNAPPSAKDLASEAEALEQTQATTALKADAFVRNFASKTPAEVAAFLDGYVTNFATAKAVLIKLALLQHRDVRAEFK